MARRLERATTLLLITVGISACEGCQKDKPYNPFGVTSSLPDPVDSTPPVTSAKPPEPGKYRPAVVAPAGSRKLKMGELVLDAPPRFVFDRALVLGEGETQQAVAWVRAEPEARERHFERWPEFAPVDGPEGEVEILREFYRARVPWISSQRP